jgi:DNA-binding MarR family transcriptional regulator
LIEGGLVASERAADDRRALRLRVTARGLAILRKAPAPESGVLPTALARLDHETLGRLEKDLEGLIDLLHPDRRAAKMPMGRPDA